MSMQEIMTIRAEDTEWLRTLDAHSGSVKGYTSFKDALAGDVAAKNDGRCDEGTFLRAFWPELQRRSDGYVGSSPCEVSATMDFVHKLRRNVGNIVTELDYEEHPELPRVRIDRIGILLGDETTGLPVRYTIEEFDDVPKKDDSLSTDPFFLGKVAAQVLWVPNTYNARRKCDIIEASIIEKISLLEVERTVGEARTDIVESHTSFTELGLLAGVTDIVQSIRRRRDAAERILDQSQRALRGAAGDMGWQV